MVVLERGAPLACTGAAMQLGAAEPAGPTLPLASVYAPQAWYTRRCWMQVGVGVSATVEAPVSVMVGVTVMPAGTKEPGEPVLTRLPMQGATQAAPEAATVGMVVPVPGLPTA